MNIAEIIESGNQFIDLLRSDENGRYKSWEHCYSAFSEYKGQTLTGADIDFLSLHLSFYLASWGMYRGSSFLLQKDYKVHAVAIKELMKVEYLPMWAIKCESYIESSNNLDRLFSLTNALKEIYRSIRISANTAINRNIPAHPISDTLISKILMGTLGCVPAYDRFFNSGVKKNGVASTLYNSKGILNLAMFYVENIDEFENWRLSISSKSVEYPQMKILDMCFWQIGYNLYASKSEDMWNE